ncbi:hypothetical protein VTN02DRAFT_746 [Thermoascus thermophilus]
MTQGNGRYTEAVTKDVQNALPQSDQGRSAGKDGPCSLSSTVALRKKPNLLACRSRYLHPTAQILLFSCLDPLPRILSGPQLT